MAEQEGFVKVDRNMLHWKWMTEPLTAHLFVVLLLKANYKDLHLKNEKIPAGSLVTSYSSLCNSSGLTIQQCRTALGRLKSTGEITSRSTNRYQVITIVNYSLYQSSTNNLTSKQQANNKQATNKQQQVKNIKNIKKGRKEEYNSRSAPDSPPGTIPDLYKDQFATYDEYLAWRNQ